MKEVRMSSMQIQYEGFVLNGTSRVYRFVVNAGSLSVPRKFNVQVAAESFCSMAPFKFQDGPSISFERLKRELEKETEQLQTAVHLTICELEIQDYVNRHYPRKESRFHKRPPGKKVSVSG